MNFNLIIETIKKGEARASPFFLRQAVLTTYEEFTLL